MLILRPYQIKAMNRLDELHIPEGVTVISRFGFLIIKELA
jgi:hypothetical protein